MCSRVHRTLFSTVNKSPSETMSFITEVNRQERLDIALVSYGLYEIHHFSSGSQRRRSLSLPVLTLIFPALLPCLVRDSLCTALQTKILWINRSLNAIDTIETWVSGNLTALTERSQPAIRWTRGGGESCVLRLFPWRTLISTFSAP